MQKLEAGIKGLFFSALVVEILVEPDGQMCEKHSKYGCFLRSHIFRLFCILGSSGSLLDIVLGAFRVPGGVNP